jgi:hypothetical protein
LTPIEFNNVDLQGYQSIYPPLPPYNLKAFKTQNKKISNMWWWSIVEVVTFILPHVGKAIDMIAGKMSKQSVNFTQSNDEELKSEMSWLNKLFNKLLGPSNTSAIMATSALAQGDLKGAFAHLQKCEKLLKGNISSKILKPMMTQGFSPQKGSDSDDYSSLVSSVVREDFSSELSMYQYRNPDSQCCVNNLDMNPFEKNEVLKFLHVLDLLRTDRKLHGRIQHHSGKAQPLVFEKKLVKQSNEAYSALDGMYSTFSDMNLHKDEDLVMCYPRYHDFHYVFLHRVHPQIPENPTVMDILVFKETHAWTTVDQNLCRTALIDSVMEGNYSFFRSMIRKLNMFMNGMSDRRVVLDDLVDPESLIMMRESSTRFGFGDLNDYTQNLRVYAVSFAALLSANWQNKKQSVSENSYDDVGDIPPHPYIARPASPWTIYPGLPESSAKALQGTGGDSVQKLKRVLSFGQAKPPGKDISSVQGG